jgi:hypothetical protein
VHDEVCGVVFYRAPKKLPFIPPQQCADFLARFVLLPDDIPTKILSRIQKHRLHKIVPSTLKWYGANFVMFESQLHTMCYG